MTQCALQDLLMYNPARARPPIYLFLIFLKALFHEIDF